MAETLSIAAEPARAGELVPAAHLFLVLQAHRPLAAGLRICLRDLAGVAVGRADATGARVGRGSARVVELGIDDPWMSVAHARFVPALGRWTVEDAGSKNGTLVNEQPLVGPRVLADGDLIEMGHTLLRFRADVPTAVADLGVGGVAAPMPGVATLLPPLARSFEALARVAASPVAIAITGPTGSGKEVVARAIHALSGRVGAFIAVNCGALPDTLVESELFGHRRGAFSGATEDRPGLVRAADGGTLFLDELAELPAPAQVALLRVLQEREVVSIGSAHPVAVDIRIVSATLGELEPLVASRVLREDFYHRLAGFRLRLPPLADRIEDVGLLVGALLGRITARAAAVSFDLRAARWLLRHAWPGNVRELERTLAAALALAGDGPIAPDQLPQASSPAPPAAARTDDDDALRQRLVELLTAHRGNVSAVARELGKAPAQIRRWLKRFDLDLGAFR
jgi:transcriptional regulator of acetoin/glycerol metabolism